MNNRVVRIRRHHSALTLNAEIMEGLAIAGFVLMGLNFLTSYHGFRNPLFFESNKFQIAPVVYNKEYRRIITSGFLHVNWVHFLFNMLALYSFSTGLEPLIGSYKFLMIYFVSLIGGELLSLFVHRHQPDYSSVGASGAISGIVFACVALFPDLELSMFFVYAVPAWVFTLLFTVVSIYGIRSQRSSIGHDAHLGGGVAGMLVTLLFYPEAAVENYITISIILIPSIILLVILAYKPGLILPSYKGNSYREKKSLMPSYELDQKGKEKELDRILEKIHLSGMSSLTTKEKRLLEELSEK